MVKRVETDGGEKKEKKSQKWKEMLKDCKGRIVVPRQDRFYVDGSLRIYVDVYHYVDVDI